jgi:hypothetical protein
MLKFKSTGESDSLQESKNILESEPLPPFSPRSTCLRERCPLIECLLYSYCFKQEGGAFTKFYFAGNCLVQGCKRGQERKPAAEISAESRGQGSGYGNTNQARMQRRRAQKAPHIWWGAQSINHRAGRRQGHANKKRQRRKYQK